MSLIARHLESNGIPTVVMGCARDSVERAGTPRFHFSNFPLGHSAGKPNNPASQWATVRDALGLFETAEGPGTIVVSPQRWADDDAWEADYLRSDHLTPEEIERLSATHATDRKVAATRK